MEEEICIQLSGSGVLDVNQPLLFSNTHDFFESSLENIKRNGIYLAERGKAITLSLVVLSVDEKGYNLKKLPKGGVIEVKIYAKDILKDKTESVTLFKNYIEVLSNVAEIHCPIQLCAYFGPHSVIYSSVEYMNEECSHPINSIIKGQLTIVNCLCNNE